jgi:hypothetical protein
MATRGAKPKPVKLRLVDGTHTTSRHGKFVEAREKADSAEASFGQLKKPAYLTGKAAIAWKEFIVPANWLDGSRAPAAILFCELWAEFRMSPIVFPAARIAQLRALMGELGLSDERNRGDVSATKEKDKFFGD